MKHRLYSLLGVGVVLLPLHGCVSSSTTRPVIQLVLSGLQQPSEKMFFRTFTKIFEAEYDVDVAVQYVSPDELHEIIADENSSDTKSTDVIMVDTAHMDDYVSSSWMSDLSWLYTNQDSTITALFEEYTHAGDTPYFVPVSFDIYISIYHQDALASIPASVEVTRDSQNQVIAIDSITWEEFSDWAIALRQVEGEPKFGFPMASSGSQLLYPLGGLSAALGTASFPSFSDDGALQAWNYLETLVAADAVLSSSLMATVTQPTALLDSEDLWMSFGHLGPIGQSYTLHPDRYVLGPIPSGQTTQRAASTAGAWAFGIPQNAPHDALARQWLSFITDPEINYLYCYGLGGVISPIAEVSEHLGNSPEDEIMKAGLHMFEHDVEAIIVDTSHYDSWTAVKNLYTDLYLEILAGTDITPEIAADYQMQLDQHLLSD